MAKRGFFAEINYQAQQAENRRRQQDAASIRAHNAAVREHERAYKAAERARAAAMRASATDSKAAEKEAARLHVEARTAEVESRNTELTSAYNDIDTLLAWTLEVDDFVDLESLRRWPSIRRSSLGNLANLSLRFRSLCTHRSRPSRSR